jgi:hypothetical protein
MFRALALFAALALYGAPALAAEDGQLAASASRVIVTMAHEAPIAKRPLALSALYGALGSLQALDVYSTKMALAQGAYEANPVMREISENSAAMWAVKAATTAGTIYVAEKLWKKNRVAAVVLLAAVNGATAYAVQTNFRNARTLARR